MATKREELADPNSCFNKAGDDEPVFVLRAKDRVAPAVVRDWAHRAKGAGVHDDEKVKEAMDHALRMEEWRAKNVRA